MITRRKESWEAIHYRPHKWFAWYPVRVYEEWDHNHWRTVWWEWVERSGHNTLGGWAWEYKLAKGRTNE